MTPEKIESLKIGKRYLHGPGPSNVYPSVLKAISIPVVGHLDPEFLQVMEEVKVLLKNVFETSNDFTIPISGTGSAGMEAAFANIMEPDDHALVCTNGYFGSRMGEMIRRHGGSVREITAPWGEPIDPAAVEEELRTNQVKVVCIVHAETSTGVLQPLEEISRITHENGALLLVDAVTSLGGLPVIVDETEIDICYSGTQKCLSCPPGLAPITISPRALSVIKERQHPVRSWYLDLTLLMKYWGQERVYHHTAPISMNFALHEALRLIVEEGLDVCFNRHALNHSALVAGLEALGLSMLVEPLYQLPPLTTVLVPVGVDEASLRQYLLQNHQIEIGSGLGELKGRVWRIGLMGHSSSQESVRRLLRCIEGALLAQQYQFEDGEAEKAIDAIYAA